MMMIKGQPGKNVRLERDSNPGTSAISVQRSNQLSYQAKWEPVIRRFCDDPLDGEEMRMDT